MCSWDGTVAYADFTAEEVGRPMSEEEKVHTCIHDWIRFCYQTTNPLIVKKVIQANDFIIPCQNVMTKGSTHFSHIANLHLILLCTGEVSQASLWC